MVRRVKHSVGGLNQRKEMATQSNGGSDHGIDHSVDILSNHGSDSSSELTDLDDSGDHSGGEVQSEDSGVKPMSSNSDAAESAVRGESTAASNEDTAITSQESEDAKVIKLEADASVKQSHKDVNPDEASVKVADGASTESDSLGLEEQDAGKSVTGKSADQKPSIDKTKVIDFAKQTDSERALRRVTEEPSLQHKVAAAQVFSQWSTPVVTEAEKIAPRDEGKPTLLRSVLKALTEVRTKTGRPFQQHGDVLVVLDPTRLSKGLLLDSRDIQRETPAFETKVLQAIAPQDSTAVVNGIRFLIVLEKDDGNAEPTLVPKALDMPVPENTSIIATASSDPPAKTKKDIKAEPSDADDEATPAVVNWIQIHEAFLRVAFASAKSVTALGLPKNATAAESLLSLENVVLVAERYGALKSVCDVFVYFCNAWQVKNTLWAAVAQEPIRWLKLSVKLRSRLVYKEAFLHVAGRLSSLTLDRLDVDTIEALKSQANAVRTSRFMVDRALQHMNLMVMSETGSTKRKKKRSAESEEGPINHLDHPVSWTVLGHWRNWLLEHTSFVDSVEDNGGASGGEIHQTILCKHKEGDDCLTLAGLYRTIGRGGDAYLPVEDMVDEAWWGEEFPEDPPIARLRLASLKAGAREIVKPLLDSRLVYDRKDTLPYLTCADVVKVPWDDDEAAEDEDVDMDG